MLGCKRQQCDDVGNNLSLSFVAPIIVTDIKIDCVNPYRDLTELIALNRRENEFNYKQNPQGVRLWNELSRWDRWRLGGPWYDKDTLALHLQIIQETGGFILISKSKERVNGELELIFEKSQSGVSRAHIVWIVVDPEMRHCGIGKQLVEQGKKIVQEQGIDKLTTTTTDTNAFHFFRANGFQVTTQERLYSKMLKSKQDTGDETPIQQIPLEWKQRERIPMGFKPVFGTNNTAQYNWIYLRYMEQLYTLLASKTVPPHLWLLRQNNSEALTVNAQYIRMWLAETSLSDKDFLKAALVTTENLCWKEGITEVSIYAHQERFRFLEENGYKCEQEHPLMTLES